MTDKVLISGASGGIGRAIAARLAAAGHDLFLLGRDAGVLGAVVEACSAAGVVAAAHAGDLRDPVYIEAAVKRAEAQLGHIDVLVNNAGGARREAVYEADLAAWRDVMDVNFTAAVHLARRVLPGMITRRHGAVVNISSISGRNTDAGGGAYAASKHALNGFSGCLYEDVRDYGIKVSSIMPGFVETALTAALDKQAGNMIAAEDVAEAVAYVLTSSPRCCPTEIVLQYGCGDEVSTHRLGHPRRRSYSRRSTSSAAVRAVSTKPGMM